LAKWEFPQNLAEVPKLYRKIDRQPEAPDFAGLITLANLIHYRDLNTGWGLKDWELLPLFKTFGLPTDKNDELYVELAALVAASQAALA